MAARSLVFALLGAAAATSAPSTCDVTKTVLDEESNIAGVSLLQRAAAGGNAKGMAASSEENPIMGPNMKDFSKAWSDDWPRWVKDTPEAQEREQICLAAFQQSYDCVRERIVPCHCPGSLRPLHPDDKFNSNINCHHFFGYIMTGSWLLEANITDSIPKDKSPDETLEWCQDKFRRSWDCFQYRPVDGGAKGGCWMSNCWRWFSQCQGGDYNIEKPMPPFGLVH